MDLVAQPQFFSGASKESFQLTGRDPSTQCVSSMAYIGWHPAAGDSQMVASWARFNPWQTAFWRAAKTFLQNDHFFFIFYLHIGWL